MHLCIPIANIPVYMSKQIIASITRETELTQTVKPNSKRDKMLKRNSILANRAGRWWPEIHIAIYYHIYLSNDKKRQ